MVQILKSLAAVLLASAVSAAPPPPFYIDTLAGVAREVDAQTALANGNAAQSLNKGFIRLTEGSSCDGQDACIGGGRAKCVAGKFVTTPCPGSLSCFALPRDVGKGTSIACATMADATARIASTGAKGGITGA